MKLYNSLSQQVETFQPRGKDVSIYACGITPYDTTHLGHAFTYAAVDVLIRYLELRELKVNYIQNITDIDDDILRKAREVGLDWRSLGKQWTDHYIEDMLSLNIRPPDQFPRASEVIDEIVRAIRKLLDAGVAYQSGGSVYFSIAAWPDFGKLSQLPRDQMLPIANQRGNHPDDPNKRDPLDFVLWQAEQPGEPSWPSPWGLGRPGWHIECSTMVRKYLGETIDIHAGGADLIFPHHECELAQMEAVVKDKPFVRLWMHTGMVRYQGEKMSKSLGNLVMVRELLKNYPPDALRVYLGLQHYRLPWVYSEDELKQAAETAEKLRQAAIAPSENGIALKEELAWAAFTTDMDNNLDTPAALKGLEALAEDIMEAAESGRNVKEAQQALRRFSSVFGLRLDKTQPEKRVVEGWTKYSDRVI